MVPPGFPEFFTRARVLEAGPCTLEGRAWSGRAAIERVEVSTDGGDTWADAALAPAAGAVRVARVAPRVGRRARRARARGARDRRNGGDAAARAAVEPPRAREQHGAARAGDGADSELVWLRRVCRSSRNSRSTSSSVLKKCGLTRSPSPRKSVQTPRASSAWQISSAREPTPTFTTPPRAARSRGVRTGSPISSAPAITWSVSSPCRARIRSTPTSAITSRPPCARKTTGAGGVPCSSRRAVGWYSRCSRSNENGSAVANQPVTRGPQRRQEVALARRGTRGPARRTATSAPRPSTGRTRGRAGPGARCRRRGNRRRS